MCKQTTGVLWKRHSWQKQNWESDVFVCRRCDAIRNTAASPKVKTWMRKLNYGKRGES